MVTKKGAFTGALQRKPGKFELATNGTLFLDEVSNSAFRCKPNFCGLFRNVDFTAWGTVEIKTRLPAGGGQ